MSAAISQTLANHRGFTREGATVWKVQYRHCSRNLRPGFASHAIAIIPVRQRQVWIGVARIVKLPFLTPVGIGSKEKRRLDDRRARRTRQVA